MSSIIRAFQAKNFVEKIAMKRIMKVYSGKLQNLMFRQTLSDKRRAIFGNDPFAA
jgi:hypothetical protein